MKSIDNVITPSSYEISLAIFAGQTFSVKKADMAFDSWAQREYGSLQGFVNALQDNTDLEKMAKAICGSFYQILCIEGKRFLSTLDLVDIDEDGNERSLSNLEKLYTINDAQEVQRMVELVLLSKFNADPNLKSLGDVKKNKKKVSPKK